MAAYASGKAIIKHADSGVEYEIDADDLVWDENTDDDERGMGWEIHHTAVVHHDALGELTWYVSEYPEGAENDKETDVGPHTLIRNFDFGLGAMAEGGAQPSLREMLDWFHANYEDPAVRTPYESREGGYQWIWGGPFDAREVLSDQYPEAADDLIERAVTRIEQDGITDWAPTERPGDYDDEPDIDDEGAPDGLGELIPAQASGIQFGVQPSGKIGIVLALLSASEARGLEPLLDEARRAAETLIVRLQGSNAHVDLLDVSERYHAALEDELSIARLYAVGLRLENARALLGRAVSEGRLPELPSDTEELLATLLQLHGNIIAGTKEGRELLANAETYARSSADTATLCQKTQQVIAAIAAQPKLIEADTLIVVSELADGMGSGPRADRTAEVGTTTTSNLLNAVIRVAAFGGLAAVTPGIEVSIPGQFASAITTELINGAWSFLSTNIHLLREFAAVAGPDLNWLRAVCDVVASLKKSQKR